jgi:hypothetical protein
MFTVVFDRMASLLGPYGLYLLEVFVLAAAATFVGELTLAAAYRINRRHLQHLNRELIHLQKLSDEAERLGDEAAYRSINKEGNDVWGRLFFFKIALSAAALWPLFFALSRLQSRYADLDLPVPGTSMGLNYVVVFLLAYVAARIAFAKISRKLPFFRNVLRMVDADAAYSETDPRTQR